jgi:hypothetical protein
MIHQPSGVALRKRFDGNGIYKIISAILCSEDAAGGTKGGVRKTNQQL